MYVTEVKHFISVVHKHLQNAQANYAVQRLLYDLYGVEKNKCFFIVNSFFFFLASWQQSQKLIFKKW